MKTCVVYESMYGNTHEVAAAIAKGLEHLGETTVGSIAEIAPEVVKGIDLLVIGGPTHVHGMSRASSREAAVATAESDDSIDLDSDAPGPGLRDWLNDLPRVDDVHGVAFDTRFDKPVMLVGSAAKGISKQLKRHQFSLLAAPESFFVEDSAGPLSAGELERAQRWGTVLANELARISRQDA